MEKEVTCSMMLRFKQSFGRLGREATNVTSKAKSVRDNPISNVLTELKHDTSTELTLLYLFMRLFIE